jgi:hypothetical protein
MGVESPKLKSIDNWVVFKDSGFLLCMFFWIFSSNQNLPCGESNGLSKFYVEILHEDALKQLMECLQLNSLGMFDIFIINQICLHN